MISNELLKKKILDEAIHGRLIENDLSLPPVDVEEIKEDIPFDIPSNWKWAELQRICKLSNGEKITDINLPYLDVKYLRNRGDKTFKTNGVILNCGDYIILVDGENSGEVFTVPEKGIMGSTFKKLCLNEKVEEKYVMILLKYYQEILKNNKTGSAIPHLNKRIFSCLQVPIPPLEEQKKIVKKIEELFDLIDKKEKNDKEKEKLKTLLKEKILDSAIHGKLVENDLTLQAVDVEEAKEDVPFDIPNNWKWSKLENLGVITSSKRVFQNDWKNEGVPFYRARDIVSLNKGLSVSDLYISEEMYKEYSQKYGVPKKGDILLTGVGTIGESYVVKENDKFYFKDGNIIWLKKSCNVNSMYLKKYFESNFFKSQVYQSAKGATVLTLTIEHAKEILIPIPPLEQQKKIVDKIEECFKLIEQL